MPQAEALLTTNTDPTPHLTLRTNKSVAHVKNRTCEISSGLQLEATGAKG